MDGEKILGKKEEVKEILERLGIEKGERPPATPNEEPKIEDKLQELCDSYIENIKLYFTGRDLSDEKFMRSIEEKMGIREPYKDFVRKSFLDCVSLLERQGKKLAYNSNENFYNALRLKVFETKCLKP